MPLLTLFCLYILGRGEKVIKVDSRWEIFYADDDWL